MTATDVPVPPKGGPAAGFRAMVLNEARLAWRTPTGLLLGIGLPLLLLVVFGELPAFQKHEQSLGGLTLFDSYVPILIALVLAALAFFSLPGVLAGYRDQGILRRLSTTPASPSWVLAAQLIVNVVVALVALVLLLGLGLTVFGVQDPKSPGGLILSCLVAILPLFACAILIGAIAPNATAAGGIGAAFFFPLMFFAGLWVPRAEMPRVLQQISDYTPLGAVVQAVQYSLQTGFPRSRLCS